MVHKLHISWCDKFPYYDTYKIIYIQLKANTDSFKYVTCHKIRFKVRLRFHFELYEHDWNVRPNWKQMMYLILTTQTHGNKN